MTPEERRAEIETRKAHWKATLDLDAKPRPGRSRKRDIHDRNRDNIKAAFKALTWELWDDTKATTNPALYTRQGADALALIALYKEYVNEMDKARPTVSGMLMSGHCSNVRREEENTTYVGFDSKLHENVIRDILSKAPAAGRQP